MKKRDHLDKYRLDANGDYHYTGDYYVLKGDKARSMSSCLFFSVLTEILLIVAGLFPADGVMNTWYVVLPYGISVVLGGVLIYRTSQWVRGHGEITEYVYDKSIKGMPNRRKAMMIILGIAFVGELVWLIIHGRGYYFTGSVLFLFCVGDALLLQISSLKTESRLEWERQVQVDIN